MASLSAHLRQAGDHGRLGFHADCPVCREERLFGALSSESVVTRRARTALLTGVVAASLTTPPAVWGQEADTKQEGVAAPHEPRDGQGTGPSGEVEDPEFDPGGDTDLPSEVETPHGTAPEGTYDDEGESGPLELEPEVDLDAPPVDPEAAPPATGDGDPNGPTPGDAAPQPQGSEPSPPGNEATEEQEPRQPATGKPDSPRERAAKERSRRNGPDNNAGKRFAEPPAPQPPPPSSPVATPPPAQTAPAAPQAPAAGEAAPAEATQVAQRDPAPPPAPDGARVHVVQPGESLWVIAKGALPPGASMARIAREVNRLWELNEGRIATGDPDLLRIGTELRLR